MARVNHADADGVPGADVGRASGAPPSERSSTVAARPVWPEESCRERILAAGRHVAGDAGAGGSVDGECTRPSLRHYSRC